MLVGDIIWIKENDYLFCSEIKSISYSELTNSIDFELNPIIGNYTKITINKDLYYHSSNSCKYLPALGILGDYYSFKHVYVSKDIEVLIWNL